MITHVIIAEHAIINVIICYNKIILCCLSKCTHVELNLMLVQDEYIIALIKASLILIILTAPACVYLMPLLFTNMNNLVENSKAIPTDVRNYCPIFAVG